MAENKLAKIEERAAEEIAFMQTVVEKVREYGLTQDELTRCLSWICIVYEIPIDEL